MLSNIVLVSAKYLILIFFLLFVIISFTVQRDIPDKEKTRNYGLQRIFIVLIHALGFLSVCIQATLIEDIGFTVGQAIGLWTGEFAYLCLLTLVIPHFVSLSKGLNNVMCMFITIGFVIQARLSFTISIRQFLILVASTVVFLIFVFFCKRARFLRNLTWVYCIIGLLLLVLVLALASFSKGAKLALDLKLFSFQPIEFVKIIFVMFVASAYHKATTFKTVFITAVIACIHIVILVFCRDLGSSLILFLIYVLMTYVATKKLRYIGLGVGFLAAAAVAAYKFFSHVRVRISTWLNPWTDIDNKGYQITQSLFAIGTGGWFGVGIFNGSPNYVPEIRNDMVFSAISEEFGAIFSILLIITWLCFILMIMRIAVRVSNTFYKLLAFGLGAIFAIQVFLNIGGTIKFIPLTGLNMPFISSGGSSLLSSMVMIGMIQALYVISEADVEREREALAQGIHPMMLYPGEFDDEKNSPRMHRMRPEYEGMYLENTRRKLNKERQRVSGKRKLNKDILRMAIFFSVICLALVFYLGYFVQFRSSAVINNSYNKRSESLKKQVEKGSIYSADGELLAYTKTDDDGNETRIYPYANLFAHTVGFEEQGGLGLESSYNFYLLSSNTNVFKKIANEFTGTKNAGNSVVTNLDTKLQKKIYDTLEDAGASAVVAMEPETGKIVGMVSKNDFDPNTVSANWDSIVADEENSVLLNRATQGLYAPGSTFKIFTLYEYMKEHADSYEDYSYNCSGSIEAEDTTMSCYGGFAHGNISLKESLAVSCNCSFANIGLSLDKAKFKTTNENLYFNVDIPIDIASNQSVFSLDENSSDFETAQTAIGQGKTLVSPLHLAVVMSAIANDGVMMKPYLVSEVVSASDKTVETFEPEEYDTLFTSSEASVLQDYLSAPVEDANGTATVLQSDKYKAYGKTGTAETVSSINTDKEAADHSWFVGYAESKKGKLVVCVIIEKAQDTLYSAVDCSKEIFDYWAEN